MYENLFDLRLDGFVLNEEKRVMYGRMHGIQVMIEPYIPGDKHRITLQLNVETSPYKDEFLEHLHELETIYPFVSYTGYINELSVIINVDVTGQDDRSNLERVTDDITAKCEECQLHSCCEFCKTTGSLVYIHAAGDKKLLCENCVSQLSDTFAEYETKYKENMFLGIIGAIVGALIGSIFWIILDQVGFIAGIAGYAIVFCSIKGYQMLGRKVTRRGIVACVIICILTVAFADYVSLGLTIYHEYSESLYHVTVMEAMQSVPYFLGYAEVLKSMVINLLIGYAFAVWASFSFIANLWNTVNEKNTPFKLTRL